jgi:hypothetical protein
VVAAQATRLGVALSGLLSLGTLVDVLRAVFADFGNYRHVRVGPDSAVASID